MSFSRATRRVFLATVSLLFLAGCGGPSRTTYQLSGEVTYDGKPVPRGTVVLVPNSDRGNQGTGASGGITDGKFETSSGHTGGEYILEVTGYDGVPVEGGEGMDEMGTVLFDRYQMPAELPEEDSTLKIEVPAGAAGAVDA